MVWIYVANGQVVVFMGANKPPATSSHSEIQKPFGNLTGYERKNKQIGDEKCIAKGQVNSISSPASQGVDAVENEKVMVTWL